MVVKILKIKKFAGGSVKLSPASPLFYLGYPSY